MANLVHPETRKMVAFKVIKGDLLLFDGNTILHGNTPLLSGSRVSYVFYANALLTECSLCTHGQQVKSSLKDEDED